MKVKHFILVKEAGLEGKLVGDFQDTKKFLSFYENK